MELNSATIGWTLLSSIVPVTVLVQSSGMRSVLICQTKGCVWKVVTVNVHNIVY